MYTEGTTAGWGGGYWLGEQQRRGGGFWLFKICCADAKIVNEQKLEDLTVTNGKEKQDKDETKSQRKVTKPLEEQKEKKTNRSSENWWQHTLNWCGKGWDGRKDRIKAVSAPESLPYQTLVSYEVNYDPFCYNMTKVPHIMNNTGSIYQFEMIYNQR